MSSGLIMRELYKASHQRSVARMAYAIAQEMELPEEQRKKIKVLMGHFGYGWHKFLPQPSTYITILRDPIDRVISHYYFIRKNPDDPRNEEVQEMSLEDFVSSGFSLDIDNGQTRIMSGVDNGPDEMFIGFGHCSTDILEIAKKNMREHFSFVGFTERFNESMILLERILGWNIPFYVKRKVNRDRLPKQDIPKSTLKCIEKYNELDIELYRFAKEIYQEQISQQGRSFEKDLIVFDLLNKCYNSGFPFSSKELIQVACERGFLHGRDANQLIDLLVATIGDKSLDHDEYIGELTSYTASCGWHSKIRRVVSLSRGFVPRPVRHLVRDYLVKVRDLINTVLGS